MSEKEFELYLSLLSRFLRLKSTQRGEIANELRDHLESRLEELSRSGMSRDDAIHAALEEFGDAAELAQHFTQIAKRRKRRFIMRCTVGTVTVLTAGILLTTAFWPVNQAVRLPPAAIAQDAKTPSIAPDQRNAADEPDKAKTDPSNKAVAETIANRSLEEKLQTRITVNFPDVPLHEAVEYIAQLTNVPIILDKKSILDTGGNPEEIINHNLSGQSLETVLKVILDPLDLTYRTWHGLMFIETVEKSRNTMEVHVYNCRDLLEGVEECANPVAAGGVFGPSPKSANSSADKLGIASSGATDSKGQGTSKSTKRSPEGTLIDVLTRSAKGPWEDVDGKGGTITAFDGLLVVRNNQQAQRQVQTILDMLREADRLRPDRDRGDTFKRDPGPNAAIPEMPTPPEFGPPTKSTKPAEVPPRDKSTDQLK